MNEIKCWSGKDAIDLYNKYRSVNDQTKKKIFDFLTYPIHQLSILFVQLAY